MFEIMNVRSSGAGGRESGVKNFRLLWDNCEVENIGGISDGTRAEREAEGSPYS